MKSLTLKTKKFVQPSYSFPSYLCTTTVRKSGRKPDGLNFRFLFFFRPLHQRGPPIIRNKNPYPEFHGKEAEIYQPQTRYEELPRLAPPREEFRDTGM